MSQCHNWLKTKWLKSESSVFVFFVNLTVYWASLRIHHGYKLSLISGKRVKDTRVGDVKENSYRRKHFLRSVEYLRVLINICSLKQSAWEFALYFIERECTLDSIKMHLKRLWAF